MSFQSLKPVRPVRNIFPAGVSSSRALAGRLAGAVALSVFAFAAHAAEPQVIVESKVVKFADLDLSKQSDAAALYARLKRASDSVCGQYDGRNLRMLRIHEECSSEALSDAVARVNAAALTSLHATEGRIRVAERPNGRDSRM